MQKIWGSELPEARQFDRLDTLMSVAHGLNITVDELLKGVHEPVSTSPPRSASLQLEPQLTCPKFFEIFEGSGADCLTERFHSAYTHGCRTPGPALARSLALPVVFLAQRSIQ